MEFYDIPSNELSRADWERCRKAICIADGISFEADTEMMVPLRPFFKNLEWFAHNDDILRELSANAMPMLSSQRDGLHLIQEAMSGFRMRGPATGSTVERVLDTVSGKRPNNRKAAGTKVEPTPISKEDVVAPVIVSLCRRFLAMNSKRGAGGGDIQYLKLQRHRLVNGRCNLDYQAFVDAKQNALLISADEIVVLRSTPDFRERLWLLGIPFETLWGTSADDTLHCSDSADAYMDCDSSSEASSAETPSFGGCQATAAATTKPSFSLSSLRVWNFPGSLRWKDMYEDRTCSDLLIKRSLEYLKTTLFLKEEVAKASFLRVLISELECDQKGILKVQRPSPNLVSGQGNDDSQEHCSSQETHGGVPPRGQKTMVKLLDVSGVADVTSNFPVNDMPYYVPRIKSFVKATASTYRALFDPCPLLPANMALFLQGLYLMFSSAAHFIVDILYAKHVLASLTGFQPLVPDVGKDTVSLPPFGTLASLRSKYDGVVEGLGIRIPREKYIFSCNGGTMGILPNEEIPLALEDDCSPMEKVTQYKFPSEGRPTVIQDKISDINGNEPGTRTAPIKPPTRASILPPIRRGSTLGKSQSPNLDDSGPQGSGYYDTASDISAIAKLQRRSSLLAMQGNCPDVDFDALMEESDKGFEMVLSITDDFSRRPWPTRTPNDILSTCLTPTQRDAVRILASKMSVAFVGTSTFIQIPLISFSDFSLLPDAVVTSALDYVVIMGDPLTVSKAEDVTVASMLKSIHPAFADDFASNGGCGLCQKLVSLFWFRESHTAKEVLAASSNPLFRPVVYHRLGCDKDKRCHRGPKSFFLSCLYAPYSLSSLEALAGVTTNVIPTASAPRLRKRLREIAAKEEHYRAKLSGYYYKKLQEKCPNYSVERLKSSAIERAKKDPFNVPDSKVTLVIVVRNSFVKEQENLQLTLFDESALEQDGTVILSEIDALQKLSNKWGSLINIVFASESLVTHFYEVGHPHDEVVAKHLLWPYLNPAMTSSLALEAERGATLAPEAALAAWSQSAVLFTTVPPAPEVTADMIEKYWPEFMNTFHRFTSAVRDVLAVHKGILPICDAPDDPSCSPKIGENKHPDSTYECSPQSEFSVSASLKRRSHRSKRARV